MTTHKPLSIAAALLAACGSSSSHPDAHTDGAGDGPAPTMTITGTGTFHAQDDTKVVDAQFNFANATITSITPDGAGFDHRSGMGAAGSFTVPVGQGAPSWDLAVQFGPSLPAYLVGNSTAPDYSQFVFGRLDATSPMQATVVTMNITGMTAWAAGDDLEIMASNSGAIVFSPQTTFATPPKANDTSVQAQTYDWTTQNSALVEASKGDSAKVFQLVAKTSGADTYAAIARLGTATGFTMTDGQPATMTAALTAVTQNKTLTVHWKRSQFAALASQAGASATAASQVLVVDALPGATARGFYAFTGAPDLVEFVNPPAGSTDLDETFAYGNPFSTGGTAWDEFVIAPYQFNVGVKAMGASTATSVGAGYYGLIPVASLATTGVIAPQISGVQHLKIAGKDLMTAQTGVGMTPQITWDAPATGTATNYRVIVSAVSAAGTGKTQVSGVAAFTTKDTQVQLPDGVLSSGSYLVQVYAFACPGADFTVKPFENGLPYAEFGTVSAQFSP